MDIDLPPFGERRVLRFRTSERAETDRIVNQNARLVFRKVRFHFFHQNRLKQRLFLRAAVGVLPGELAESVANGNQLPLLRHIANRFRNMKFFCKMTDQSNGELQHLPVIRPRHIPLQHREFLAVETSVFSGTETGGELINALQPGGKKTFHLQLRRRTQKESVLQLRSFDVFFGGGCADGNRCFDFKEIIAPEKITGQEKGIRAELECPDTIRQINQRLRLY